MTDSDIYQREPSPNQIYLREVSWCQHRGHIHRLQQVVALEPWCFCTTSMLATMPRLSRCRCRTHQGGPERETCPAAAVGLFSQWQMPSVFPRVSSVDEMQTFRGHIDSRWYQNYIKLYLYKTI